MAHSTNMKCLQLVGKRSPKRHLKILAVASHSRHSVADYDRYEPHYLKIRPPGPTPLLQGTKVRLGGGLPNQRFRGTNNSGPDN